MTPDGPAWGEPPIPDVVARLLRERWSIPATDRLIVDVDEEASGLSMRLTSNSSALHIGLRYRSGAGPNRDPWMVLVDALDALVGQLEENGRDHRALPAGEGVMFQGVQLAVEVERTVPELQKIADRMLTGD